MLESLKKSYAFFLLGRDGTSLGIETPLRVKLKRVNQLSNKEDLIFHYYMKNNNNNNNIECFFYWEKIK